MSKINWGVLGTAGIAEGQTIPGMQLAKHCNLYAIAGRSLEKAEAFKNKFGFEKAYGSYEELLADPNVTALYIPLPNTLHCEWAIRALNAGKHVLCEKPLAPSVEEMEKMMKAAKDNNVLLMEAFAYLHSPLINSIKQEIDNGVIGDILYADSCFITSDYDMSNIRMRKETAGGAVYDLGCYTTTQILWLMGEEPATVNASAVLSDDGIDLLSTGVLTFSGRKRATFTCGMVLATEMNKRIDRLQVHGTKGFIKTDAAFNACGTLSYTVVTEEGERVVTIEAPQNYSLEVDQLSRCIMDGETQHVTHAFTLMNGRTLERILKSIGY